MKTNIHLSSYLAQFLELKCVFFLENLAVFEIMWKNILQPGRQDDEMVNEHLMLDI